MPYRPTRNQRERKHTRNAQRNEAAAQRKRLPFCEDCGTDKDLTAEHGKPLAEGGLDITTTLCRPCNVRRYRAWVG